MNKVVKGLKSNSEGMTLVEVIVALAILGVVAVAFLAGLTTAFKADIIADERSTALTLAHSQMEYVKSQDYAEAPSGSEATYDEIDVSEYPGYSIKSTDRAGSAVDDIKGIPWDPESGQPSTDDEGIQKVTIIVEHNGDTVFTLEDYKVDR